MLTLTELDRACRLGQQEQATWISLPAKELAPLVDALQQLTASCRVVLDLQRKSMRRRGKSPAPDCQCGLCLMGRDLKCVTGECEKRDK